MVNKTNYSDVWKNTDTETERKDKEAEEYAKELAEREVSDWFGMGVDDNGY